MREPEQRVTALLNDEIQIGQFVPPHMRQRVEKNKNLKITPVDSVEIMFLAMQPKPPFDKKEVRQAVCHAINRDQIIATLLEGFASRLDGPIGPRTIWLRSELETENQLRSGKIEEAFGAGRFSERRRCRTADPRRPLHLDKQLTEAMVPDAQRRGHSAPSCSRRNGRRCGRACKKAPCLSIIWAAVRCRIPSAALHQYFHTGETPRIGYSNPKLDELLDKEQQEFDPKKRRQYLSQAMSILTEDAPACFMWRHKLLWGLNNRVEYKPLPDSRIYAIDMAVRR